MNLETKSVQVILLGEASVSKDLLNYEEVARNVILDVGYDAEEKGLDGRTCEMKQIIVQQSPDITAAVRGRHGKDDWGAGDQGMMFGYATDEFDQEALHPVTHMWANQICQALGAARRDKSIPWLRPDCKSQVVVEYMIDPTSKRLVPLRVDNILISTQHEPSVDNQTIKDTVIEKIIMKVVPESMLKNTRFTINPSGKFDVGGPAADAGLTGRKIIVDTYGGWAPHGGGAFSGKDPSKTDRSGAYYTRYVAKSLVAAGLAHRVLVQVSYAIGVSEPQSLFVDSFGSARNGLKDKDLMRIIRNNFDFRPGNMIKELNLKRPIYFNSARFGAFGRKDCEFPWEQPKKDLKLD